MSKKIRNIIFDLGGVLINIDYHNTRNAFEAIGFKGFEKMYNQYSANKMFEKLETGKLSNDLFFEKMLSGNPYLQQHDIKNAWNAMLLDFRVASFRFLEKLKENYHLYLLSNTNSIHREAFNEIFRQQTGEASIDDFFIKSYYSNLVGLRKPNKNIFRFVLKDAGIKAPETLFIDDSCNNIETAKQLGFRTHLLLPGEKIEDLNYD